MRTKEPISFLRVLNDNLANNPYFAKLFEVTSSVIDEQIGEQLSQLVRARTSQHIKRGDYLTVQGVRGKVAHLKRVYSITGEPLDEITLQLNNGTTLTTTRRTLHERPVLIDSSRYFGFDYYSDFLKDEDFARIADYVSSYWPADGKPEFIKFIGFVKSLALDIHQLWTQDKGDNATSDDEEISKYDQLEPKSDDQLAVWKGGKWYPTSHVEITYDALLSEQIDDDLVLLFYNLAPIHLVLERISGSINVDLNYTLVASADIQFVDSGYIKIGA